MTRPSPHRDPRRALGVRAGPTPILPRLNVEDHDEPSDTVSRPYPTPPDSYSSTSYDPFHRPDNGSSTQVKPPTDRGAIETRKLLSHVLTKLEQRDACPDLLEMAISAGQSAHGRDKGKAKMVMNQVIAIASQDADELEEEHLAHGWNNEATCDLVEQLRSLLVLAERQGLRLFDYDGDVPTMDDKPQRKSKAGRFSSLASPTAKRHSEERHAVIRQTLLERTLTVLGAMLLDESLHRTIRFRPTRPPHTLQAFCLDIASCLFAECDKPVKIRVMSAVVDGLAAAVDRSMAPRYCAWIERHLRHLASLGHDWYHLVPRLLSALSPILADSKNLSTFHQAHRLLSVSIACKPDMVNDLLHVISSGPPDARQIAIILLATFQPQFGRHNTISANPTDLSYASRSQQDEGTTQHRLDEHHFLLWRCEPEAQEPCIVCQVPVEGAGLMCTLCKEVCHIHCMDTRSDGFHYEVICLTEARDRQEAVTVRFSRRIKSAAEIAVNPGPSAHDLIPTCCSAGDHRLHLVNLINLALCWHCRQPLWGSQPYACLSGCQRLYHTGCLGSIEYHERCSPPGSYIIDEVSRGGNGPFTISTSALQNSLDDQMGSLLTPGQSFDELAIAYGILWTQYHMFKNGIASRSIRVVDESGETSREALPFRTLLKDFERRLKECKRPPNAVPRHARSYLFDRDFLRQCGEILDSARHEGDAMLQSLRGHLNITNEPLARYFCEHLLACGTTMGTAPDEPSITIDFDKLAGAIQVLLEDLDLTNNELGMRVLTARAWPSDIYTPEYLVSVGRSVIGWVMTMGEKLHQVVREYASRQRPLPGVRSSDSSVATYKASQQSLLIKFVQPWLATLHHLDSASFVEMAYHIATESAKTDASIVIEKITILSDAGVIFGSTMDLLVSWLEDVSESSAVDTRVLARFTRNDSQGKSALANLWIKVSLLSAESLENFANTCGWMRVLAATGLHIPLSTLSALSDLFPEATAAHVDLTVAIKTCQTPDDPQHLADLAIRVGGRAVEELPQSVSLVQEFWSLLLAVYRNDTRTTKVKADKRAPRDDVRLSPKLVSIVSRILSMTDELDDVVLDGLSFLLSDRSRVRNVDIYIDENCAPLYELLWDRLGASKLASELLYRLVSINAEAMREILNSLSFDEDRTLRFLLDLRPSPTVRSPTVGLVSVLILSITKLGGHTRGLLLPARLQILSDHIEANLLASSDEIRLEVMPKVLNLMVSIPDWQVISLASVDMLLADVSATLERLSNATSAPSLAARSDATRLRLLLVVYGLIAYTREKRPNWHLCQRFVIHVSIAAAAILDSDNNGAFFTALAFALDSSTRMSYSVDLAPTDQSVLVGAPYLPVALSLIRDIGKAPDYPTQRHLLSLAMVAFSKHTLTGMELATLGALQTVAEYASLPSDSRLLALQVLQVAYTTLRADLIARVAPSLYLTLSAGSEGNTAVDDRTRLFMRKIVSQSSSRFFIQTSLLGSDRFAKALRGTRQLDKALGFLPDVLKRDRNTLDQFTRTLQGISVGDSLDPISADTIESVGSLLSRLARHVAEWDASEFDPNSTLCFVASILARAPEEDGATLTHQTSTFLHLCLARFPVDRVTITKLLEASQSFRSVLEIPGNATPVTLLALFEYFMDDVSPHTMPSAVASACVLALRMASRDTDAETMIQLRLKAANLLIMLEKTSAGSLRHQLAAIPSPFVHLQIFLPLLMALSDPPSETLAPLLPLLARVLASSFQQVRQMLSEQDLKGHGADILSQAFAILQVVSTTPKVASLWVRIWSDWQELLKASLDPKVVNGPLRALVQSNFADFVVHAHTTDSILMARYIEPIQGALQELLVSPARQSVRKLNKAASLSPALIGKPLDVESIRHGMITAERMKMLRAM